MDANYYFIICTCWFFKQKLKKIVNYYYSLKAISKPPPQIINQMIPKIIHQIWIGPRAPPYQWINSVQNFAKRYGYQYFLWRETDILDKKKLSFRNINLYHQEKNYPGKADIARYEILHQYGGIYIDADSLILSHNNHFLNNLFQSIKTDSFAVYEIENSSLIANGVIGCIPKSIFIEKIILYIKKYYPLLKFMGLKPFITTGPYCFTRLLYDSDNTKYCTILPSSYFYPVHWVGQTYSQTSEEEISKQFPNACMFQFGYSSNKLFNINK